MVCADTECRIFSDSVPALREQDSPATLGAAPTLRCSTGPTLRRECVLLCRNVLGCMLGTFVRSCASKQELYVAIGCRQGSPSIVRSCCEHKVFWILTVVDVAAALEALLGLVELEHSCLVAHSHTTWCGRCGTVPHPGEVQRTAHVSGAL